MSILLVLAKFLFWQGDWALVYHFMIEFNDITDDIYHIYDINNIYGISLSFYM